MTNQPQDWDALARAVKTRREHLRLQQDLVARGGPGHMTVRKIERGEVNSLRPQTKTQLERALDWPFGQVDALLGDAPVNREGAEEDWAGLAEAVRRRRNKLGLRQSDVEARGGPGGGTVRNIEQSARTKYSSRTLVQLEQALGWPEGTVQLILSGVAQPADVDVALNQAVSPVVETEDAKALRVGRAVLALIHELEIPMASRTPPSALQPEARS